MNDRDHVGLANGTASPQDHLPRYFGKHATEGTDPKGTKKMGFGKGNWGRNLDELEDYHDYTPSKPRRRSNSFTHPGPLRTKFEAPEEDPVFEEEIHGASALDFQQEMMEKLSKTSTSSSSSSSDSSSSSSSSVEGLREFDDKDM